MVGGLSAHVGASRESSETNFTSEVGASLGRGRSDSEYVGVCRECYTPTNSDILRVTPTWLPSLTEDVGHSLRYAFR